MGLFSNNRTKMGSYDPSEIIANESYYGEIGALQIAIEGAQNDAAIFNELIENDFEQTAQLQEGAISESEVYAIYEASVGGFVEKIKAMVKKLWEKLKGLFNSFIARVNSVIIRDNKKFVEKYRKAVVSKDLSKMKYKWSEKTSKFDELTSSSVAEAISDTKKNIGSAMTRGLSAVGKEDYDWEKYEDDLYGASIGGTSDAASFAKDFHDACWNSEDEEEGLSSNRLTTIMGILINSSDTIKNVEKCKSKMDKEFSDTMKQIDKLSSENTKAVKGKDSDKDELALGKVKIAQTMQKAVTVLQSVSTKVASCVLAEVKFDIAQSRRVFAKAAAYNPKSVKEDAVLLNAVEEAAFEDCMTSFQALC